MSNKIIKMATITISNIITRIDNKCFLKLLAASMIATTQHTSEMVWIVLILLSHFGKSLKYIFIWSTALMPLYRKPMDDHMMKSIKAGNKKNMANTAVAFLGIWALVDIRIHFCSLKVAYNMDSCKSKKIENNFEALRK